MRIGRTLALSSLSLFPACAVENAAPAPEASTPAPAAGEQSLVASDSNSDDLRHVLLLSIDGMHAVDLANFVAKNPQSSLAWLSQHGVSYSNAWVNRLDGSPSNPSDSFPGLLALTTGGSSPTHGGWYDVSYARELYPSASACAGAPGTGVAYDESVDLDSSRLWGNATDDTPTHDSTVVRARIDGSHLPLSSRGKRCAPVYPHQYIRVNTIFEVAKEAHLRTAWSDKHLAYELVNGPSGAGVDDLFAPEINSDPSKSLIPTAPAGSAFTSKTSYTEVYDDYKVQAILNQIDGRYSDDGLPGARDTAGPKPGTPALFGMNFQALSVAQKSSAADGGYLDAAATPGAQVADALQHTDASIGKMVDALGKRGLLKSTLIIVTAKHGQSPIDKHLYHAVDGDAVAALVDAAAPLAGHIEDDVALYWLKSSAQVGAAVSALRSPAASPDPRVAEVMSVIDPKFVAMFGDPARDPRTPDVVVQPEKGTIYSLSKKKDAEHGGFADDDAHVALLVANPRLKPHTETCPVRTKQVAPTVLRALDLDPERLDAVRRERTKALPGLGLRDQ